MHRLYVYLASSASLQAGGGSWLFDHELRWAGRFRREARRRQFLDGRILLKRALHDAYGWPAQACHCSTETVPSLTSHPQIRLSISHSGAWVACAIAQQVPCGVDIQCHVPRSLLEIAEAFFAPDEHRALCSLQAGERDAAFWRLWTLKEAWCKASGHALFDGLGHVADGDDDYRALACQPVAAVTLAAVAQADEVCVRHWDGHAFRQVAMSQDPRNTLAPSCN